MGNEDESCAQRERSPSRVQENPEPPQSNQESVQSPEEADGSTLTLQDRRTRGDDVSSKTMISLLLM